MGSWKAERAIILFSTVFLFVISLWRQHWIVFNIRMVVAGGRGVGKSALAVRFLTRRFSLDIFWQFFHLTCVIHILVLKVHWRVWAQPWAGLLQESGAGRAGDRPRGPWHALPGKACHPKEKVWELWSGIVCHPFSFWGPWHLPSGKAIDNDTNCLEGRRLICKIIHENALEFLWRWKI